VEDDQGVRVLMEHVLIGGGYQVDPAATLEAPRTLIGLVRYDLVLADGVLPDGSGIVIAEEAERRAAHLIDSMTLPRVSHSRHRKWDCRSSTGK